MKCNLWKSWITVLCIHNLYNIVHQLYFYFKRRENLPRTQNKKGRKESTEYSSCLVLLDASGCFSGTIWSYPFLSIWREGIFSSMAVQIWLFTMSKLEQDLFLTDSAVSEAYLSHHAEKLPRTGQGLRRLRAHPFPHLSSLTSCHSRILPGEHFTCVFVFQICLISFLVTDGPSAFITWCGI